MVERQDKNSLSDACVKNESWTIGYWHLTVRISFRIHFLSSVTLAYRSNEFKKSELLWYTNQKMIINAILEITWRSTTVDNVVS